MQRLLVSTYPLAPHINYLQSKPIHVGLKQHSPEWNHQGENEVDINHLDIGGWGQAVAHLS